jgi:hypothetical protein
MHATEDLSALQLAAAEALAAGRAAARLLRSPASDPKRQAADPDPGLADLARRLSGNGALAEEVTREVEALLARCVALIAVGTETRTDWMPKSVCGDDVTEWEPWTSTERTPEAEGLVVVADALRRFLARRDHVADLVRADAAFAVLRGDRGSGCQDAG